MFVLDFLGFLAHMGFIEIPLNIMSSILELTNGGQGRQELNGLNVLIQTDESLVRVSTTDYIHVSNTSVEKVCVALVNVSHTAPTVRLNLNRCLEVCNDVIRLIVPAIGTRRTHINTLIIDLSSDIVNCYGSTTYGIYRGNPGIVTIRLSCGKMVSESHLISTLVHELGHALLSPDRIRLNRGHDNSWFTVTSHLAAIINGNLQSLHLNSPTEILVVSVGRCVL